MANTTTAPTWADNYRAAAMRLLDIQQNETDGLVRSALGDAAAKYVLAAIDHEEAVLKLINARAA